MPAAPLISPKSPKILGVGVDKALELQRAAAQAGAGSWCLEGADFAECWAPFSNVPTNHLITRVR